MLPRGCLHSVPSSWFPPSRDPVAQSTPSRDGVPGIRSGRAPGFRRGSEQIGIRRSTRLSGSPATAGQFGYPHFHMTRSLWTSRANAGNPGAATVACMRHRTCDDDAKRRSVTSTCGFLVLTYRPDRSSSSNATRSSRPVRSELLVLECWVALYAGSLRLAAIESAREFGCVPVSDGSEKPQIGDRGREMRPCESRVGKGSQEPASDEDFPTFVPDPTISLVVTCYNYGHFLESCLVSLLSQTRRADELIVVNDGSTDLDSPDPREICREPACHHDSKRRPGDRV